MLFNPYTPNDASAAPTQAAIPAWATFDATPPPPTQKRLHSARAASYARTSVVYCCPTPYRPNETSAVPTQAAMPARASFDAGPSYTARQRMHGAHASYNARAGAVQHRAIPHRAIRSIHDIRASCNACSNADQWRPAPHGPTNVHTALAWATMPARASLNADPPPTELMTRPRHPQELRCSRGRRSTPTHPSQAQ